ncbi:MAG: oligoendopeptidase F [Lachnospiraceae bacterium]|nr:oligoendopeptidase F [Lachnospiraceae bacterium]
MKREDIAIELTWNMQDVYDTDELFLEEYKAVGEAINDIKIYKGCLSESAEILYEYFKLRDELNVKVNKLYFYANQKLHENLGNSIYQEYAGRTDALANKWMTLVSFEEPEIMGIGEEKLMQFIYSKEELSIYERAVKEIFRMKEHILPEEMSELLAMTGEIASGPSDIFAKFSNVDLKFPVIKDENGEEVALTHGNYIKYLESKDRGVRKSAFEAMYETYEKYGNLMASVYNASVKKDVFYAKAEKYSSTLDRELDSNDIPKSVYMNLIKAVHKNLPLMYRYVKLRKKTMGYDKLHMYDIYAPIIYKDEREISYEEAKTMVSEGLKPMGKEYLDILKEGFNNRWIDVCENEGKRSGAYSWSCYGCHPYVLLNYQSNLDSVFTLAHEMGHAIHSYYTNETQPSVYSGYTIFVAEVASICNESLLLHHLLENIDSKDEKIYLINNYLEKFRGTLFRQVMFAEFELLTHEKVEAGEFLTKDSLCEMYYDLNKKYYGEEIADDKLIEMEWARIPHFYTPFYVYQYATGFAAAIALSGKILKDGEGAVKDYMKFLSGGCSKSPIELLKMAGVDMTIEEPVDNAMKVFEGLLEQMEGLV